MAGHRIEVPRHQHPTVHIVRRVPHSGAKDRSRSDKQARGPRLASRRRPNKHQSFARFAAESGGREDEPARLRTAQPTGSGIDDVNKQTTAAIWTPTLNS